MSNKYLYFDDTNVPADGTVPIIDSTESTGFRYEVSTGLRISPVADESALIALNALDYQKVKLLDSGKEYVFELGKTPAGTDVADAAATGSWVLQSIEQKTVIGSYVFNSSGETGFSWTNEETQNTTDNITNNGSTGHLLSGGVYKVTYTAQKQTNSGGAAVAYRVNGVNKHTNINTTENSGAAMVDIVDATTVDQTIRFVRTASFGQGNTNAQLVIEKLYDNIDYVRKGDVLPVDDSEVTLIDVDATDNTFYAFSTGETWADIKSNYERLIITGNTSQVSVNNIRPYSFIWDLGSAQTATTESGFVAVFDDNQNSVQVLINTPANVDTGFTYQQSNGDAPTNGRMQFKVVAVKARKTVSNPEAITIDDQSASNYVDIGNMRIQWGTVTATGLSSVTLPAPFANTSYNVVSGADSGTSAPAISDAARSGHVGNKTTTAFSIHLTFADETTTGDSDIDFSWQAIGLKP